MVRIHLAVFPYYLGGYANGPRDIGCLYGNLVPNNNNNKNKQASKQTNKDNNKKQGGVPQFSSAPLPIFFTEKNWRN